MGHVGMVICFRGYVAYLRYTVVAFDFHARTCEALCHDMPKLITLPYDVRLGLGVVVDGCLPHGVIRVACVPPMPDLMNAPWVRCVHLLGWCHVAFDVVV